MAGDAPKPDRSCGMDSSALFQGIVRYGTCGCAMTPYRTKKHGRSYLYYICQHSTRHPEAECLVKHLPAAGVEELVLEHLRTALNSPELLAGVSRDTGKSGREVQEFMPKDLWEAASPGERQRLVQLLVESVTIYENSVKLELNTSGLKSVTEAYGTQNQGASGNFVGLCL